LFSVDFCDICSLSAGSPVSFLGRSDLRGLTRLVFLLESRKFRKNHNQHLPLTQPFNKIAGSWIPTPNYPTPRGLYHPFKKKSQTRKDVWLTMRIICYNGQVLFGKLPLIDQDPYPLVAEHTHPIPFQCRHR
jgi:hypothetical protein